MHKRLCDGVVQKLHKQLDIPERRQMIFELLGEHFVHQYFPDDVYDPAILVSVSFESSFWLRSL